jgi:large subunit ribosomal protein L22
MEARALQRTVRQSARKMRLVIDQIRGRAVPEAYAILKFSKKLAAKQIHKVLKSAVANAEQHAQRANEPLDVDRLRVRYAVVNEGATLKRFTPGAMGRATPIMKRTSHVEIRVGTDLAPAARRAAPSPAAPPPPPPPPTSPPAGRGKAKGRAPANPADAKAAARAPAKPAKPRRGAPPKKGRS